MENNITTIPLQLRERMMNSDDEGCLFKRGDFVEKVNSQEGDTTLEGTKGKVIGNIYDHRVGIAGYMVEFEGFPAPTFILEIRLRKYEEGH